MNTAAIVEYIVGQWPDEPRRFSRLTYANAPSSGA